MTKKDYKVIAAAIANTMQCFNIERGDEDSEYEYNIIEVLIQELSKVLEVADPKFKPKAFMEYVIYLTKTE